ncbi:MAG: hypothetical protein ABEI32_00555 [Halothece sp.]
MNSNSNLINTLVELSAGIFSGFLIEILIDIVSLIMLYFAIGLVFVLYPFMTPGIAQNPESSFWKTFFGLYSQFWLIKLGTWLGSSFIFSKIGSYQFGFGSIYITTARIIGFYALVWWTITYASLWQSLFVEVSPIKSFLEKMPPPLSVLIYGLIAKQ